MRTNLPQLRDARFGVVQTPAKAISWRRSAFDCSWQDADGLPKIRLVEKDQDRHSVSPVSSLREAPCRLLANPRQAIGAIASAAWRIVV
jgi:hypothetical protein